MATNKDPIFLNTVSCVAAEIDNAQGTTSESLFVAGADGGALTNVVATTTDTSNVTLVLSLNDGSTTNVLGEIVVDAGAGTDGATPSVNVLDSTKLVGLLQSDGSLLVGANCTIEINAKSAVTAATVLSVTAAGGSYSA